MTEDSPKNYNALMSSVGAALHSWSLVESALGIMFHNASDIPNPDKSGAIFDAVISFEARIAVLDAAMDRDLIITAEERAIWVSLSSRLRKLYRKRHEVAHFGVTSDDMRSGARIVPFFSWHKDYHQTSKYLSRKEIDERGDKFSKASEAVTWFCNMLQRQKFPPARRPQPIPEPSLIAHIRGLIDLKKQEPTLPPAL